MRITSDGREIEYTLVMDARSKRVRISVGRGGEVVVSLPRGVGERAAERFVREKSRWIARKVEFMRENAANVLDDSAADPKLHKRNALALAEARIAHWNAIYRFDHGSVTIRNQKTRWGSCTRKGGLNFNRKMTLLPLHLVDYVVVHELCHLREFNHSPKFWALVARTMPDYRVLRKELGKYGIG